jgi:GT2 family glycosyltransferase
MKLSFVIISYNRRQRLLDTLARVVRRTLLPADQWEIIVVDNASSDGTPDAVAQYFPKVKLIRNSKNEGMCARNRGIAQATGQYVIALDDDSYPADGRTTSTALAFMDKNPAVGAVTGKVVLPGGGQEATALPGVFIGCAVCFRKAVLERVGGFRREFFRQAEEYDLSFRIWIDGFRVERREEIIFKHAKTADPDGRADAVVQAMDLRNNLIIAQRFLPGDLRRVYWEDWQQRYAAMARHGGNRAAARKAMRSAWLWRWRDMLGGGRMALPPAALESIFGFRRQSAKIGAWSRRANVWRVVLAGFSKNMWATYNACLSSGLQLRCVADENPAFEGLEYHGLPIVPNRRAFEGGGIDGVVVTNVNPAQVDAQAAAVRRAFKGPVLTLVEPGRAVATATKAVAA